MRDLQTLNDLYWMIRINLIAPPMHNTALEGTKAYIIIQLRQAAELGRLPMHRTIL